MDRINHVKLVTPDPGAVQRFLTEVVDIPEGWSLGEFPAPPDDVRSGARDASGEFTAAAVDTFRGAGGGGLIVGSTETRQFQVLAGAVPHIWGIAIGTRNLEAAHERCVQAGFPCTEPALTPWGDAGIRFFFAEAGGIVFEVMRAEAAG
jgi:catechol 2,3-dioxygenase-like lactoylglutathione lyase family enzyme